MKNLIIIIFILISASLFSVDISFYNTTKTLGNETTLDFYRLVIEGKAYGNLEIESMYEWIAEDDTVYTSYRLKMPFRWKKLQIAVTRIEIERQEIFLTQLDLRYLLEKSWLASADIGIGSQWIIGENGKLEQKWKFILGKKLKFEFFIGLINVKVKSETDFQQVISRNFKMSQN